MKKHVIKLAVSTCVLSVLANPFASITTFATSKDALSVTSTPIKHVVVIFQENVSFDHYFATYPYAKNLPGETPFMTAPNTPSVNGLNEALLNHNPNAANPQRLSPAQAVTDDMDHEYTDEQKAFDNGLMDKFVEYTSGGKDKNMVMNYYDGNTVTGLWNYAQHFAMSDNSYDSTFGPSTPGALNLISGQTHGATLYLNGNKVADDNANVANGTVIGDPDPYNEHKASLWKYTVSMTGKNIGDLLNEKGITWGWFEGGFRDPSVKHAGLSGQSKTDYNAHHEPFQYYPQTANPDHLPPTSVDMIGVQDQANHQYDLTDFWAAADSGHMPAVSYLKAPNYQDGHAGYSNPIDEQEFLANTINHLQQLPEWKDTAVIISYDDSDGWYDHVMSPMLNGSNDKQTDILGMAPKLGTYLDRAGYGPRLPLLVISPYAKSNFVDHSLTDQSSILRFIEDNWNLGRIGDSSFDQIAGSLTNMFDFNNGPKNDKLFLNPKNGTVMTHKDQKYGEDVSVVIDNYAFLTSTPGEEPFISGNNHTMVPLTDFASYVNGLTSYDNATQTITLQFAGHVAKLHNGSDHVTLDGKDSKLDAPVWVSTGGRTYIPLRSITTLFGFQVDYNNGVVKILTK